MNKHGNQEYWNRLLLTELPIPKEEIKEWVKAYAAPYKELMSYYRCAMMEVETKFRVLNEELSLEYDRNPIETIKTRLKSESSILKKLADKGYEPTVENVEKHIHDIIGFRIVCSFLSDVYDIVNIIKSSKNFKIKNESDYIANPKDTGYVSYHLNVLVPIHLEERLEYVEAEIQIRTLAMDFWASLDHKLQYKLPKEIPVYLQRELLSCSDEIKILDAKMQHLYEIIKKYTEEN